MFSMKIMKRDVLAFALGLLSVCGEAKTVTKTMTSGSCEKPGVFTTTTSTACYTSVYTQTKDGTTSVVTTTVTAATTVTMTSSAAAGTDSPCPAPLAGAYSSGKQQYQLFCATNFVGNDLQSSSIGTFSACIAACDAYVPTSPGGGSCVGVSWTQLDASTHSCNLKGSITTAVYGDGASCSAKLVRYLPDNVSLVSPGGVPISMLPSILSYLTMASESTPPSTSSVASSSSTTSVSSAAPVTSTTSSVPSPSSTTPAASSTTSSSTATAGTCAATSTLPVAPCPDAAYGSTYDAGGFTWQVYCSTLFESTYVTSLNTTSFDECMSQGAAYVAPAGGTSCASVVFKPGFAEGDNCYFYGTDYQPVTGAGQECKYAARLLGPVEATIAPCPFGDGSSVSPGATTSEWEVACETLFDETYMSSLNTTTFEECMVQGLAYTPPAGGTACGSITFKPNFPEGDNCYFHSADGYTTISSPNKYSAKLLSR